MLRDLDRRIAALEGQDADIEPFVLFRSMVTPGHLGSPRVRAQFEGASFDRLTDEAEEVFQDRVRQLVSATAPGRSAYAIALYGPEFVANRATGTA